MTLREAAEKSGLSHTYIRDLELGVNRKTKTPINPSPETLKRLASAYNYDYNELMKKAGYIDQLELDVFRIKNPHYWKEVGNRLKSLRKK